MTDKRIPLLIAGLGNVLLGDDGVGVHAVRALMQDPVEGAEIMEIGCAVLDALGIFEEAEVVLALDAVQAGKAPGTIYEVRPDDANWGRLKGSIHDLGLREALGMIKPELRPDVVVLGVEPEVIDYGMELSEKVKAVLPRFIETVREDVGRMLG